MCDTYIATAALFIFPALHSMSAKARDRHFVLKTFDASSLLVTFNKSCLRQLIETSVKYKFYKMEKWYQND